MFFTVNAYSQHDSIPNNAFQTKQDLCLNVVVETDKFTNEVKYNSPDIEHISFIKYKSKGATTQYVSIMVYDTYLSYDNSGLIILFKSGKKIIRENEKISVSSSSGSYWRYHAFFTPSANEIKLLKGDEIIGIKLYIFDSEITEGNLIKAYANCVLVSPKSPIKKKK